MKHWSSVNILSVLLLPLSFVFCLLVWMRRKLYQTGINSSWKSPVPVVVVGNISVGGTGKTPVVLAIVEYLKSAGYKPGVVSRGYGGAKQEHPFILDKDTPASMAGDEPVLISRRTAVPVCVFPDRSRAVQTLLENSDCDVVVTDDGLQHYALARDFEIAVVDGDKLHGNGWCLPSGPLREPVSRLDKTDFVLFNRNEDIDDGKSFRLQADAFHSLGGETKTLNAFAGKAVHAVAGTASPQRFFKTLESLGVKSHSTVFPDHHAFTPEDFAPMAGQTILMTEKDAVKCTGYNLDDAWYLGVTAELPDALKSRLQQMLGTFYPEPRT